jgi:hypothetical protein
MKFYSINKVILVVLIFFGMNVLTYCGVNTNYAQFLIMALSMISLYQTRDVWKFDGTYVWLLLFVFVFACYKLITDSDEGTRYLLLAVIGAPLLIGSFLSPEMLSSMENVSFWKIVLSIVVLGYIGETGLALYEHLQGHSVFGWVAGRVEKISVTGVADFRSTGLYGHPLYNALMVSIAMTFFLISSLKLKYKFMLWMMGFVAVLCFNARAGIVMNAAVLAVYLFHSVFINQNIKPSVKIQVVLIGLAVFVFGAFLLVNGNFGGRLIQMGLFDDGSAQVRVDIWEVFKYYSIGDFFCGMDHRQISMILYKLELSATENFWLDWLFRFGIIFLIPLSILYCRFISKEMIGYPLFSKLLVLISFLMIASTNNSLSSNFMALFYFLLLTRLFHPKYFELFVGEKFLDKSHF